MKKQQKILSVSLTPQEYGEILIKSGNEGLTVSSYSYKKLFSNPIETKLEKGGSLITDTETVKNLKNKIIDLEKEISALKSKQTPIKGDLTSFKTKVKGILARNPNLIIEKHNGNVIEDKFKPFCMECYQVSLLANE